MNVLEQAQILKKTAKILAGQNIKVYMEGFAPRVVYDPKTKKPKTIFIPELPEGATSALLAAMHGYIDHECGHILLSSGDDICDSSKSKLWHYIHNCIEDPRVNAGMSSIYPGCEANIRAGYNYIFNREDEFGSKPYSYSAIMECDRKDEEQLKDYQVRYSSLWFAKKSNCRFSSDKYDEIKANKLFDPLEAKMNPAKVEALASVTSAEDVRNLTDYFVDFFYKEFSESEDKGEGGADDSEKKKERKPSSPKPPRLEDLKKVEDELAEAIGAEVEHLAKRAAKNYHFSDRFDIVKDKKQVAALATRSIAAFEDEVKRISNYLSKDLKRLLESRNRRWYTGGWRSGRLNQKSLHSVKTGNDRIFSRKSEVRDVKAAVGLLIDMSGSMRGEPISIAMKSAYAFALTLESLKIPYEIYGFTTERSDILGKKEAWARVKETISPTLAAKVINPTYPEVIYPFKKFGDNFDLDSKKAMINIAKGSGNLQENEDSYHVKRALERLAVRPEEQKTLFVFSDGSPAFLGDTKKSQEMLKYLDSVSQSKYGVDIFGIGIKSNSVSNYYKNYKVIKQLGDLPAALFGFLKTRI